MAETKSEYTGRKIRNGSNVATMESKSTPKEGVITFNEAINKNLLKPGMAVIFKECNYGPLNLQHEDVGKEQQITYGLKRGIVVKDDSGKLSILALLQITSEEGLCIKGRYGRANGWETIKNIVNSVTKKIPNADVSFLTLREIGIFFKNDYLVQTYLSKSIFKYWTIVLLDGKKLYANDMNYEYPKLGPKCECIVYNIAISIEGDNLECSILANTSIKTLKEHTYLENPYSYRIEIRGES